MNGLSEDKSLNVVKLDGDAHKVQSLVIFIMEHCVKSCGLIKTLINEGEMEKTKTATFSSKFN